MSHYSQYGHPTSTNRGHYSNGAASLPYMSRSISVDSYSAAKTTRQSSQPPVTSSKLGAKVASKNCELEEYARRYEALQRGNSSRRRKSQQEKRKELLDKERKASLQHEPSSSIQVCSIFDRLFSLFRMHYVWELCSEPSRWPGILKKSGISN